MHWNVVSAIFRRNLISYFSTPTGYVFICLFVMLTSLAAFLPDDFFNANLANLDTLNRWIPLILLMFIPAITMSIWADERRQGTDELLLTIPASDTDVVIGKFFAVTGIFSVSLLFSMLCNLSVLYLLAEGELDKGQFFSTYFGYWLMGEAMLAIGMIASFLTSNLTVAFILGLLFNTPLILLQWIVGYEGWSLGERFSDFGRGVFTFTGLLYFASIVVLGLYVCMVLIGKRHWSGGRDGVSMGWHYLFRIVGIAAAIIGVNAMSTNVNARVDISQDQINSLSPATLNLLGKLDAKRPVRVEVYVSRELPESFARQKRLVSTFLREMKQSSKGLLDYTITEVDPNTDEAFQAEQKYGIVPRETQELERGVFRRAQVIFGMAFTSLLDKLVVPFVDKDLPIEYELMRSIWSVNQTQRKKIGIVTTDAAVLGGGMDFMMGRGRSSGFSSFAEELKRLYDVSSVNCSQPISADINYDVLVAVQPSSLGPTQLKNFVDAVKAGHKTIIFEDPFPVTAEGVVPGTYSPKSPRGGGMMGMQQPPEPKGNIQELWNVLGVELEQYPLAWQTRRRTLIQQQSFNPMFDPPPQLLDRTALVWSAYIPNEQLAEFLPREFVWISRANEKGSLNEKSDVVAGLNRLLIPLCGAWAKLPNGTTKLNELVKTGQESGTIALGEFVAAQNDPRAQSNPRALRPYEIRGSVGKEYILAAHITGQNEAASQTTVLPLADEGSPEKEKGAKPTADKAASTPVVPVTNSDISEKAKTDPSAKAAIKNGIDVLLVSDIDCLNNAFFTLRERSPDEIDFTNDNVSFVLNMIDVQSGQTELVAIQNRSIPQRPIQMIEVLTKESREENDRAIKDTTDELQAKIANINTVNKAKIDVIDKQMASLDPDKDYRELQALTEQRDMVRANTERQAKVSIKQAEDEAANKISSKNRDYKKQVKSHERWIKIWAVILPPIPPLVVGFFVYFSRRMREKEGVSRNRLR